MAFPLLPVLHLDRGVVREAPREPAAEFVAAAARKHGEAVLVDARGLAANAPDLETIQRASRNRSLWVDGGSRTVADVSDLFVAGAARVTARWNTLADSGELTEAAEMTEGLYLGIEVGAGLVANPRDRLSASKLAEIVARYALPVVVIDLAARGGPSPGALALGDEFRGAAERWYLGVAGADAAALLEERGYAGAMLPFDALPGAPP